MLACVEVTDAFANEKVITCPIVGHFVLLVTVTYLTLEDESFESHTFFSCNEHELKRDKNECCHEQERKPSVLRIFS